MNTFHGSKLFRMYLPSEFMGAPIKNWPAADLRDKRRARGETFATSAGSTRPKYPPPPRSGNVFAAAVLVGIPGLLLLMTLLWVLNSIRNVLDM